MSETKSRECSITMRTVGGLSPKGSLIELQVEGDRDPLIQMIAGGMLASEDFEKIVFASFIYYLAEKKDSRLDEIMKIIRR